MHIIEKQQKRSVPATMRTIDCVCVCVCVCKWQLCPAEPTLDLYITPCADLSRND